jgi:hypothetical protein
MYRSVIRRIALPAGETIPVLGQGTWHMAEVREQRKAEIGALRLGLDLGMTLIDTTRPTGAPSTRALRVCAGSRPTAWTCTYCIGGVPRRSGRRSRALWS